MLFVGSPKCIAKISEAVRPSEATDSSSTRTVKHKKRAEVQSKAEQGRARNAMDVEAEALGAS